MFVGVVLHLSQILFCQYSRISAFIKTKGKIFVEAYKKKRLGNLRRGYGRL